MTLDDAVAVVGMACRFPGANGIEEFWRNLCEGVESISDLPAERLAAAGVVPGPGYVARGGLLEGVDRFDAEFFGFSPREAELLDPQQRLFLECSSTALQRAGHDPARFAGSVGVFGGVGFSAYLVNNILTRPDVLAGQPMLQVLTANDKDHAATRTAYKLNLRGPAVTVQTACSTSLTAVHLAAQSLIAGECDLALAGGATVNPQGHGYQFAEGGVLSPDGHCRPFDVRAAGTVPASGAGVVVLRRLADALADGDTVHAVIRGSAMNNDGAAKVGYTAPSVAGQAAVIREALAVAQVDPATVGYVEAHAAATALGDPIEVAALSQAFGGPGDSARRCALGSVKGNLGHLDAAAGVAGFIKAVLAVEHGVVPATANFTTPNPVIDFEAGPFFVTGETGPWPGDGGVRRAGVNAFGLGGTNVHVVLEQAPERAAGAQASSAARPEALLLSGRTPEALDRAGAELGRFLAGAGAGLPLPDAALSLRAGRPELTYRRVVVAGDTADAARMLTTHPDHRRDFSGAAADRDRPLVFLVSGVGDHYRGLGAELYRTEPLFREEIDRCARILRRYGEFDPAAFLRTARAGAGDGRGPDLARLLDPAEPDAQDRPVVSQPLMFVVNYALATMLMRQGARPTAVGGYSVGELVAACLAGVLSLEDALRLVVTRAELIDRLEPGAMLAVLCDGETLEPRLGEHVAIAGFDGPQLTVVSGQAHAVDELARELAEEGVACRRVPASHAFHSPMMSPVAEELRKLLGTLDLRAPELPVLSNVTGTWLTDAQATSPEYFAGQVAAPVRFGDNLAEVWRLRDPLIVEIGPGQSLGSLAMQHPARARAEGGLVLSSLPGRSDQTADSVAIRVLLGRLWAAGLAVDWSARGLPAARRVPLPAYPFQRERYWIEPGDAATAARKPAGRSADPADWFYLPSWKRTPPARVRPLRDVPVLVLGVDGFADRVTAALEAAGAEPVAVRAVGSPGGAEAGGYEVDFTDPEQVDALVARLAARPGGFPALVADCRTAACPDLGPAGLDGLLNLVQSLVRAGVTSPVDLAVFTHGAARVAGERTLIPQYAMLAACGRVVAQECANIAVRTVDLDPAAAGAASAVGQVLAELAAVSREQAVSYRDTNRWTSCYEQIPLEPPTAPRTRRDGVYLLVGGLSRVGMATARHLARTPGTRLAFVQRTPMPPREAWDARLADPATAPMVAARIEAIRELEELGARTMILTADVSDGPGFTAALAAVEQAWGPLNGAVHCAGTVSENSRVPLIQADSGARAGQLSSKVLGAPVLAAALEGRDLDFVLLNSSIGAVLGGIGSALYASANAFLDLFAPLQTARTGVPWISLLWEGWTAGTQDEAGYGAHTLAGMLVDDAQGEEIVARVLGAGLTGAVVNSTGDLDERLRTWVVDIAAPDRAPSPASERHARPHLQTGFVAPRTPAEEELAEIWHDLLGIEQVGVFDNFFSLGGHSLVATRVMARVAERFGVHVAMHDLLTRPTIAELAEDVGRALEAADGAVVKAEPIRAVSRAAYRGAR